MYLIDNKIDFSIEDHHIRKFERYIPSIPIGKGVYSDTGSRVRLNNFMYSDGIF